jgi:hypothetical protein
MATTFVIPAQAGIQQNKQSAQRAKLLYRCAVII